MRLENAASRMQTLIQDLLVYSRTKTEDRKFETVELKIIVEEVKDSLKEEIAAKHAIIETGELCEARIIPFQFHQLLHNLLSNAIKFSRPEVAPRIIITSGIEKGKIQNKESQKPGQNYCHITVRDNGIGFEQKYNDLIFELFQRLHGKDQYEGTGIGLAIVRKIVENHNGYISVSSEVNKGTSFDIYIPGL
jgi:signal transduction histidine kinase